MIIYTMTVRDRAGRSSGVNEHYAQDNQRTNAKHKQLFFHNASPPLPRNLAWIKEAADRQRQRLHILYILRQLSSSFMTESKDEVIALAAPDR